MNILIQVLIIFMGLIAAYLMGRTNTKSNWYGMLIQTVRQLPFILLYWSGKQWLMFGAAIAYFISWGYTTWRKHE